MSMFIIQIHNIMTDFLFNEFIINKFVVTVDAALILQMIATLRELHYLFVLVVNGSVRQSTEKIILAVHFVVNKRYSLFQHAVNEFTYSVVKQLLVFVSIIKLWRLTVCTLTVCVRY